MTLRFIQNICILIIVAGFVAIALRTSAQTTTSPEIRTEGTGSVTRLAPGEFLPFSVKLINFGNQRRVDVTIKYQILDSQNISVYSQNETVAVETTASFIKQIQLPFDMPAGQYTAVSSIVYEYQEVPATSQFEFTVEPKWFGFFRSDLIFYLILTAAITIAVIMITRWFITPRMWGAFRHFDYSDKPKEKRLYYQIISDTIAQMRVRSGDNALVIAEKIPGLRIDSDSGKVLEINANASEIVRILLVRYETLLGNHVDFSKLFHQSKITV